MMTRLISVTRPTIDANGKLRAYFPTFAKALEERIKSATK